MRKCKRCGCSIDSDSEFCQWCNPIVEFIWEASLAIQERFGRPFLLDFNYSTSTVSLRDNETGDEWEIEFRVV